MSAAGIVFIALFILAASTFVALALWLDIDWVDDDEEGEGK